MKINTKCKKRNNQLNLILDTKDKTLKVSLYYMPKNMLIKHDMYSMSTVKELYKVYLNKLNNSIYCGYEVENRDTCKIIYI